MSKTKRYILLSFGVILLLAVGTGYYMYNKPAQDVQSAEGKKVMAVALYDGFAKDSMAAKRNYSGKILQVSGVATQVSKNQQNNTVVLLRTNSEGAFVNCTIEGSAQGIVTGSMVEIKGICNGMGEGDADLGILGDVYLVRCHVVKS
jgi:hypothetical protein